MNIYFAYGSNLDENQMKVRCPYYEKLGCGYIKDYELCFPKTSKKWEDMGVASIRSKQGSTVEGALYILNNEDLSKMDKFEGGYDRIKVEVIVDGNPIEAYTYMVSNNQYAYFKPSYKYINQIYEGAQVFKLSDTYIDHLKTFF
jgi:gamma-glutamylcyclotransferase (GGCT)/AIG2-like uncharacterized protein YtfP